MSQNIWQILNFDDLLYFIRKGAGKIVVLFLVLPDTEDNIKKIIKKIMKEKSVKFPNVLFLYYTVRNDDFKTKLNIIDKDLSNYPKMYHIYDRFDVFMDVSKIDNIKVLEHYFKQADSEYLNSTNNINENANKNDNYKDKNNDNDNQFIENIDVTKNENILHDINNNEQYIDPNIEQNKQELLIKEQEKFAEKLLVLKNTADAYNFMFLDDIQKRKKEEEKLKKKNQKEK